MSGEETSKQPVPLNSSAEVAHFMPFFVEGLSNHDIKGLVSVPLVRDAFRAIATLANEVEALKRESKDLKKLLEERTKFS